MTAFSGMNCTLFPNQVFLGAALGLYFTARLYPWAVSPSCAVDSGALPLPGPAA